VRGRRCQHFWLHGIPKTGDEFGERINRAFRKIITE